MKKILLLLSILTISFSSIIAATASGNLNPFAYDLSAELNQETMQLTVHYTLNAPATSVVVRIFNGNTEEKSYTCSTSERAKGSHTISNIDLSNCSKGVNLTWRVDVKGVAVNSPTCVKNDVRFYAPTSVDIDNNPMNDNFGTVFVIEGFPTARINNDSKFLSGKNPDDGAGLYILNADGTPREIPGAPGRYGYNGARVKQYRQYFYNNSGGQFSGYSPYRVRVSDCGRVFITTLTPPVNNNGTQVQDVLWEADPKRFRTNVDAKGDWKQVMSSVNTKSYLRETKLSCGDGNHNFCGIYNLYTANSEFIAGPNIGFDVKGSGENLKLLMLSACREGIAINTPSHYYCYEYNIGTKTVWDEAASKHIFTGHTNRINVFKHDGTQVQYDGDGNVWVCSYTATNGSVSTLVKVNGDGTGNYIKIDQSPVQYRRCGGIRFNNDYTQFVVASNMTGAGGGFDLYAKENGTFVKKASYNTYDYTGASIMDFAWDHANNLYIAGDGQSDTGQRIAVYAMPHTADKVVSTPAKTALVLECDPNVYYTITANSDNSEYGSVAISSNPAMVEGKVQSCAIVTVTATPKEHYRFVEWKVGDQTVSTNPTYSFYAKKDLTVTAYFDYAKHNVTWHNLFMKGKDIDTENPHFPGINERLWRMFQARYRFYKQPDLKTGNAYANQAEYNLDDRLYVRTDGLATPNLLMDFMEEDPMFQWLKAYIEGSNPQPIGTSRAWEYHLFGFFNRTNKIYYNSTTAITDYMFKGNYEELGKPEKWAPIWTETILGLPQTMEYGDYTPINWIVEEDYNRCPFKGRWVTGWHTNEDNGEAIIQRPDAWYKHNTMTRIASDPSDGGLGLSDWSYLTHILAWRNGSINGGIVTIINGDMDLYATYVEKNIDEYDVVPAKPENYDATNDDVIKLLQNPNYLDGTHDLTISRQLQAGMYNTICLPFDLNLNALTINHPFYGAKAMQFTGVTPLYNESNEPVTVLQFTEVTRLEKGVPYLIQVQNDVVGKTSFSGIHRDNLTSITQQITPNGSPITFHGTINPTEIPAQSLILVANNRLALTTITGDIAGMRGYFSIDPAYAQEIAEQAANGRVYLNFQKPSTTSIPVAPEAEQSTKLNVEKLIIDGHLYILRGEEVYTITGSRVR